jgi:signal transduction histidine kinase
MIRRLWPQRLAPQLALLSVALLIVVQLASVSVIALLLPRTVSAFDPDWLTQQLAELADGAFAVPKPAREAWLATRPELQWFSIEWNPRMVPPARDADMHHESLRLKAQLQARTTRDWENLEISTGRPRALGPFTPPRIERVPPLPDEDLHPSLPVPFFLAIFKEKNGDTLLVRPSFPGATYLPLAIAIWWLAVFLTVASLVAWWAIARIAGPLGMLARAAERFGRGIADDALPRGGAREVRTIADSFAEMRRRVARFVADRTTMMAAISHDLRTPLTRMRLRVERVEDGDLKSALHRDIDALEAIARETLEFARLDEGRAGTDRVDLSSLLQTLADERGDVGDDVVFVGAPAMPIAARAGALSRAVGNLVDNAVAYGRRARLSVVETPGAVRIDVDDDGPGIAPASLEDVFRPFVRLETSRNRDSGGTGLGLAIARNLARAQGGDVMLENRLGPDGAVAGLRASLTLPKDL